MKTHAYRSDPTAWFGQAALASELVSRDLDELSDVDLLRVWRWHGIGVLQRYVTSTPALESRLHVWSPKLERPGIWESGSIHDHRFTLHSSVLAGALEHEEFTDISFTGDRFDHTQYVFPHARIQDPDKPEEMRIVGFVRVRGAQRMVFGQGMEYWFPAGAFHRSRAQGELAVTFCVKHDQQEARASVLAPSIETPVPAFQKDALPEGVLREVLTDAGAALDEVVRTCLPWAPMRGNELLSDLRTRRESP